MALKYLNLTGLTNLVTDIMNWVTSRIPTKTSEIDNDSGFITASDLPTNHVTTNTTQTISGAKTFSSNLTLNQANLVFTVKDSNATTTRSDTVIQANSSNSTYGINTMLGGSSNTIIKAGEGAGTALTGLAGNSEEHIYLIADGNIRIQPSAATYANAKTYSFTSNGFEIKRPDYERSVTTSTKTTSVIDLRDKNDVRYGLIENNTYSDKHSETSIYAYNTTVASGNNIGKIGIGCDASGNLYTVAPTPATSDNSTKIATTAYVKAQGYLTTHQSLTDYATKSYVDTSVANLVNSAPTTLDTLNELATALGNDPNFATTVATSIGTKANDSDVVHLAGTETITGAKTFKSGSTVVKIRATNHTKGVIPSGNQYNYIQFEDTNGVQTGFISKLKTNGYSCIQISTSDLYKDGAMATDGTSVSSTFTIGTSTTGIAYWQAPMGAWESIYPHSQRTSITLGTSSNQWAVAYVKAYHAYDQNAFTAKNGNYTFLIRNDGNATYFLMSESGGNEGTWSSARPLTISNSTGVCNINGNAATSTQFSANKDVTLTGAITGTVSSQAGWIVPTALKFSWNATGGTVTNTYFKMASGEVDGGWNRYEAYVKVIDTCNTYHSCNLRIFIMVNASGLCDSCTVTVCELKGWSNPPPVSVVYKNSTNSTLFEIYGQIGAKNHQYNCIVLSETSRTINTTLHPNGPSSVLVMHSGGTPVAALPDDYTVATMSLENYTAGTFTGNLTGNVTGNCSGSSGSCTGNAATATEFSANKSVTLTGDVTGTASSKAGWSVATTLANSGVTAGTYGPSADVTGNNNSTISVPQITVDAKGRVTSVTNRTLTCKNNTYNVYNKTLTIQKNGTNVATFTSNSNTDVTANITVPTKTSDLTNDSGFLTSHQSLNNYVTLDSLQNITGIKYFNSLNIKSTSTETLSNGNGNSGLSGTITCSFPLMDTNAFTFGEVAAQASSTNNILSLSSTWRLGSINTSTTTLNISNTGTSKAVYPNSTEDVELGTATNKWIKINGLNPGSLGLPVTAFNSSFAIDTQNFDLTGENNLVTVTDPNGKQVPGWVLIYISKCAATDWAGIYLTSYTRSPGVLCSPVKSGSYYYIKACFPCSGTCYVKICLTAGSIGYIRLYPFEGNVGFAAPA